MRPINCLFLVLFLIAGTGVRAQVSVAGLADFELRLAGDDSSPYVNQTPGSDLSLYTPNLRLFFLGDISDQWFVNAQLQADHYEGKKLSKPFFSVFNVNWTPSPDGDLTITAGRFVTPYGSYSDRFLSADNPFVHLPLSHASGLPLTKNFGLIGVGSPPYNSISDLYGNSITGMTMVYSRMYAQGLRVAYSAGEAAWLQLQGAATLAPASSHSDYGQHDVPSFTGRAVIQPVVWASAGLSFSRGSFLFEDTVDERITAGDYDLSSYRQQIWGADITFNYRYYTVVLEWNRSRWKAPFYDPSLPPSAPALTGIATVHHLSAEMVLDLPFLVGGYLAVRYEQLPGGELETYEKGGYGGKSNRTLSDWTYDRNRLELAAGYKLDRTILLKGSYLVSGDNGPALDDNVLALQLSVLF